MSRFRRNLAQSLPSGRRPRRFGVRAKLGPMPGASLQAMDDYGLNDIEIGHYYGLTPSTVRRLRRALSTGAKTSPL